MYTYVIVNFLGIIFTIFHILETSNNVFIFNINKSISITNNGISSFGRTLVLFLGGSILDQTILSSRSNSIKASFSTESEG